MRENGIFINSIDLDGRCEPFGIDSKTPVFHYTFFSPENGKSVTSSQVLVRLGEAVAWDSGKRPFPGLPYVRYEGEPLRPMSRYSVQIRAWDELDQAGPWSEPVFFETGLMDGGFQADWIEPEQENTVREKDIPHFMVFKPNPEHYGGHDRCRPALNLVRDFTLEQGVEWARVYMSAHGVYELYLNGQKAGKASLAPEVSAYQTYLYYQTYDVTPLLRPGKNRIAVTLADGWWAGRIGLIGASAQYGDRLGVILQLEARLSDGTSLRICSDEAFRSSPSGTLCADLHMGEIRDNNREPRGWKLPEFDPDGWTGCHRAAFEKKNLIAQPIDPVEDDQVLLPTAWLRTPRGECVVDFGQVISGTIELTVEGEQGQKIVLDYCEVLDKEGNYFRNITGRNKDQTDTLICAPGRQTWRPTFTYHGFRYVRIQGIDRENIIQIKAVMLATRLRSSGSFTCSDEKLTQLQHNIVWGELGNMLSIPTDCPQREKTGWTGDIQVFAKTGAFNYDLRNFLSVWLMNLRAEQKENGAVPLIVPDFPIQEKMLRQIAGGEATSSGWSDACILLPWYLYQCYGQIELLEENFACMTDYLAYVEAQAARPPEHEETMSGEQRARSRYLWNKGYHYGDWLIPSLMRKPNGIDLGRSETREIVGSCWYAIVLEAYLSVCTALSEQAGWKLSEKIQATEALLQEVRRAIREEYVQPDGALRGTQLQGSYVMVLRSGAVEGEQREKTAAHLAQLIRQNGDCLDTGFSSVSFLLDVLTENGYKDLAYRVLFQTKSPSWLYMVERGATTIWENWEAITPEGEVTASSYNHYAYGCVGDWIYRNIGGIRAGEPGYRHIVFAPDFGCGLDSASASYRTPFGTAACSWQKLADEYCVELEVPVGAAGEFRAGADVTRLTSGKHQFHLPLPQ
ncbi:MAG: family 78 glycoside hydrolase catalytic domain [Oscillospiraceae bacterium]